MCLYHNVLVLQYASSSLEANFLLSGEKMFPHDHHERVCVFSVSIFAYENILNNMLLIFAMM